MGHSWVIFVGGGAHTVRLSTAVDGCTVCAPTKATWEAPAVASQVV